MDTQGTISQRVYRDGTRYIDGKYVKDLSALGRPLEQVVIVDDNADCISMQVSGMLFFFARINTAVLAAIILGPRPRLLMMLFECI